MYNFEHPVFQTRGSAEATLELMRKCIAEYGFVTVDDLYDLAGIEGTYKDTQYGWTKLDAVEVTRTRSGYILQLPDVIELEPKRVKSSPSYRVSYRSYCENDIKTTKRVYEYVTKNPCYGRLPSITNVIYNDPATIVFWADGTKTVVKVQEGYEFDPMAGLSMAICEKAFGSKINSHKVFNKWLPKEDISDRLDRLEAECKKIDTRILLNEMRLAFDEAASKCRNFLEEMSK